MPSHGAPLEFLESILDRIEANRAAVKPVPKRRRMTEGAEKRFKDYRDLYFDLMD